MKKWNALNSDKRMGMISDYYRFSIEILSVQRKSVLFLKINS